MLGGIVAGALGLSVVAVAPSVPVLVLGWAVTQLGIQALLAAITAVLPDQIPLRQRGRIGGLIGMGQSAATTLGTGLLTLNATSLTWGLLAPVCLAAITVGFLCLVLPDRIHDGRPRPPLSVREIASSFWSSPRRYPDFAWTWVSRLLVFMGITILIVYQTYFLLARIGVPPASIAAVMFGVLLLENGVSIAANLISGYLSDRAGRRKIFVATAACLGALGFAVAGLSQTLPMFLVGVTLLGAAKGVYVAVDLAMATDLLPAGRTEAAKNMGLFTIASLFPNLLAPTLARSCWGSALDLWRRGRRAGTTRCYSLPAGCSCWSGRWPCGRSGVCSSRRRAVAGRFAAEVSVPSGPELHSKQRCTACTAMPGTPAGHLRCRFGNAPGRRPHARPAVDRSQLAGSRGKRRARRRSSTCPSSWEWHGSEL
jgi:MFS family permease